MVVAIIIVVVAAGVFAMRMSYEKYCIRTRKPFLSWIKD